MKPEQVADVIEKLIDEHTKLNAIANVKTLGGDLKKSLAEECRKKIAQLKAQLIEALKA